jgi:hypothetical protein
MDHGLAPDEGDGAGVVAVDEGIDMVPELLNIGEAGAGQRAALRTENQTSTWLSQEL